MNTCGTYNLQPAWFECIAGIGSKTAHWNPTRAQRAISNLYQSELAVPANFPRNGGEEQPSSGDVQILFAGFYASCIEPMVQTSIQHWRVSGDYIFVILIQRKDLPEGM
jgi:hypothetical protein